MEKTWISDQICNAIVDDASERGLGRVLLLGAGGGVAQALLGILARHPVGMKLARRIESIVLADKDPFTPQSLDLPMTALPPINVRGGADLSKLIDAQKIDLVIELAEVDTIDCLVASASSGANYMCAGSSVWPSLWRAEPDSTRLNTLHRATEMLPKHRPSIQGSHLFGSGMNPGIVNSLVDIGIQAFAQAVGTRADVADLGIHSILFTEEDTTTTPGFCARDEAFPMSWSPEQALYELLEPHTGYMARGKIKNLNHQPHTERYRARCGKRVIDGFLVPHEEVVTIGARYPTTEVGYIYRILPAADDLLSRFPDRPASEWDLEKLYPLPQGLTGGDSVGVLLCSAKYGEFWIGFENFADEASRFGTNSTLMQAAAGTLAGMSMIGGWTGARLVEEIDAVTYLSTACAILGEPKIVWRKDAPALTLEKRRVSAETRAIEPREHIGVAA